MRDVAGKYIGLFSDSPHPYIREKVSDIEDLAGRLLNLLNQYRIIRYLNPEWGLTVNGI